VLGVEEREFGEGVGGREEGRKEKNN